ncbi:MAG: LysR substrate-binding domain-containing protein [Clostridiales bacterium]|nr:LysR substrate-binding domain-containing protein [Clostridiales bacterium]
MYAYPLILWIEEDPDAEKQYAKLFRPDERLVRGDLVVENLDLTLHLLKASNAVGAVNKVMVEEELNRGELLQLTLKETLPQQELVMFHSKLRPLRRSAQQFKELVLNAPCFPA